MRFALLFIAVSAFAQPTPPPSPITATTVTPAGACSVNQGRLVGPTGTIYTCQGGTWAAVAGSSSACPLAATCVANAANLATAVAAGGTIYVGPTLTGTTPPITVTQNGTYIICLAPEVTITETASQSAPLFLFENVNNGGISDCNLNGNGNASGYDIETWGQSGVISGFRFLRNTMALGIYHVTTTDVQDIGNTITAGNIFAERNSKRLQIQNNEIHTPSSCTNCSSVMLHSTASGQIVSNAAVANNLLFTAANFCEEVGDFGSGSLAPTSITSSGNTCTLTGSTSGGFSFQNVQGLSGSGDNFNANGFTATLAGVEIVAGTSGASYGATTTDGPFSINKASNNHISGNCVMLTSTLSCVYIGQSTANATNDNDISINATVLAASMGCYWLQSNNASSVVSGNHIHDAKCTGGGTATGVRVENNAGVITNNSITDLTVTGTANNAVDVSDGVTTDVLSVGCLNSPGPGFQGLLGTNETVGSVVYYHCLTDPQSNVVDTQTGTTYTVVAADTYAREVSLTNTGNVTVTIPPISTFGFPSNSRPVFNYTGAGTLTLTPSSGSIVPAVSGVQGPVSVVLTPNGSNWSSIISSAGSGSGGISVLAADTSGSGTTYAAPGVPVPTSYTQVAVFVFIPQTNGAGGAMTLNVNSLGPISLKAADCSTNLGSTSLVAGQVYLFAYNGTVACQSSSSGAGTVGGHYNATWNAGGTTTCAFASATLCTTTASSGNTTLANTGMVNGATYSFLITNDPATTRTITYPGNMSTAPAMPALLSAQLYFSCTFDGTNVNCSPGTILNGTPGIVGPFPEAAAPSTTLCPAGETCIYGDSTAHVPCGIESGGTKACMFTTGVDVGTNGQVTNGSHITNNSIGASGLAVAQTRRTIVIDNYTGSSTVLTADQFQGRYVVPQAGTIVEVDVSGGTQTLTGTPTAPTFTGTGSIQIGKQGVTNSTGLLSAPLATASGVACALVVTSGTCIFNNAMTSSSSVTISTTALSAGDEIYVSAATADGAQTWYNITIVYTVN